jgi:beta-glucosidase
VTRARLITQAKLIAGGGVTAATAKPFAEAEHLLTTGRYGAAPAKSAEAYRAA